MCLCKHTRISGHYISVVALSTYMPLNYVFFTFECSDRMVLCPGFQKNGRPCTNILEQKNKFCKLCGWKINPEIFSKEAISCPNIVLNSEEKCGTWIERDQMFCDQCGWEVNHDYFPSRNGTDSVAPECSSGLQTQIKKLSFKQESKLHQNSFLDSLVTPGIKLHKVR